MTSRMIFIDPVTTGDTVLAARAAQLRNETDALLGGDTGAIARANALITSNEQTALAVYNATKNAATPPGLAAWRAAYFTFRDTVDAMKKTQSLPPVVVTGAASTSGWKIPGTNIIVPWIAVAAVVGFVGVAWYVVSQRRGKRV